MSGPTLGIWRGYRRCGVRRIFKTCPKCGCATFHIPSGRCSQCGYRKPKSARRRPAAIIGAVALTVLAGCAAPAGPTLQQRAAAYLRANPVAAWRGMDAGIVTRYSVSGNLNYVTWTLRVLTARGRWVTVRCGESFTSSRCPSWLPGPDSVGGAPIPDEYGTYLYARPGDATVPSDIRMIAYRAVH